jgi:hypothetical protein
LNLQAIVSSVLCSGMYVDDSLANMYEM